MTIPQLMLNRENHAHMQGAVLSKYNQSVRVSLNSVIKGQDGRFLNKG